jgi:hypothetical protein
MMDLTEFKSFQVAKSDGKSSSHFRRQNLTEKAQVISDDNLTAKRELLEPEEAAAMKTLSK